MKQNKNPGSINLSFKNCHEVKINNIVNGPFDKTKSLNKMLKIHFDRTNSKKFGEAINYCTKIGGIYNGSYCLALIPDSQIFKNLQDLKFLNKIVYNWESLTVIFRNNEVNFQKFLNFIEQIYKCSQNYYFPKNCQINDKIGWGCKFLIQPKYHLMYNQIKLTNTSYWYNYGYFSNNNEWTVNKNMLKHIIKNFIKEKGIDLCPHFSYKRFSLQLNKLPDKIIIDGKNFEKHYSTDFNKNGIIQTPDNIRHILPKEKQQEILKRNKIKELEYQIGMNELSGEKLERAKCRLAVLREDPISFSHFFKMAVELKHGYHYSDN
jgi:hypothetical protein